MTNHLPLLAAVLLLAGASSTFAASSTDLTVKGRITPASCTPLLANNGIVDYGKKSAKDLNLTSHTQLESKSIQLTVNCNGATQFAIRPSDNRPDTVSQPGGVQNFGLGLINGSEKLGQYYLEFRNPLADVPVKTLWSAEGEKWGVFPDDELLIRDYLYAFGNVTAGVATPEFLQNLTVDVAVHTLIAPANSLTLTQEVSLDGSAMLQIEYL